MSPCPLSSHRRLQYDTHLLPVLSLLIVLCSTAAAAVSSESPAVACDQWSSWQQHSWGSVRRKESCSNGAVDEECKSAGDDSAIACSGAAPSSWRPRVKVDQRQRQESFVYRSYSSYRSYRSYRTYLSVYSRRYTRYTRVCATSCIIGASVGALFAIGLIVGGVVGMYCLLCRKRPRRALVQPMVTTAVMSRPIAQVNCVNGYYNSNQGMTNPGYNSNQGMTNPGYNNNQGFYDPGCNNNQGMTNPGYNNNQAPPPYTISGTAYNGQQQVAYPSGDATAGAYHPSKSLPPAY